MFCETPAGISRRGQRVRLCPMFGLISLESIQEFFFRNLAVFSHIRPNLVKDVIPVVLFEILTHFLVISPFDTFEEQCP